MSLDKYRRDILIAVGVMIALALVYTVIQTWSWTRRSGRLAVDFITMLKFMLFACGNVATALFIVIVGSCIWWLFFFKVCSFNQSINQMQFVQRLLQIVDGGA